MKNLRESLLNNKFTRLTVKKWSHQDSYRHNFWECECDCGKITVTSTRQLKGGFTRSCGCIRKFNGSKNWKGFGELSHSFWNRICYDAKRRGHSISITIEDAWLQFLKQNRKCSLTGMELNFGFNKNDSNKTASLDRIDSFKGYTKENIQWVHKDINRMKQSFSELYFQELVEKVYLKAHSPK